MIKMKVSIEYDDKIKAAKLIIHIDGRTVIWPLEEDIIRSLIYEESGEHD